VQSAFVEQHAMSYWFGGHLSAMVQQPRKGETVVPKSVSRKGRQGVERRTAKPGLGGGCRGGFCWSEEVIKDSSDGVVG
jgi:hypothetical protein